MESLVSTGQRGLTVAANASTLNGTISAVATTVVVISAGIFVEGNTVTIDQEDITLGPTADGGLTFTACTRQANSTTGAIHNSGANVRLAAGTQLLTHTFDGSEDLIGIHVGGQAIGMFGIEYDGVILRLPQTTAFKLDAFCPMRSVTPANTKVLRVLVWLWPTEAAKCVFWADVMGS